MNDLHTLVYVSAATSRLDPAELDGILQQARARNLEAGISGMLLHCEGNFMQLLEGPRQVVLDTFARIRANRKHDQIIELMNEAVAAREFPDFTMAFSRASAPQFLALRQASWPQPDGDGAGMGLLREFWASMR